MYINVWRMFVRLVKISHIFHILKGIQNFMWASRTGFHHDQLNLMASYSNNLIHKIHIMLTVELYF